MKRLSLPTTTALFVMTTAVLTSSVQAQQSAASPAPRVPFLVQRSVDPVDAVLRQLQDLESDFDKSEIRAKLRTLLEDEYDRMMEAEAEELEKLEQRLVDLREQLGRRRAAKTKMVDLRLETLVNEAEGFGWPGRRSRGAGIFGPKTMGRLSQQGLFSDVPFPDPPAAPAAPLRGRPAR